MGEWYTLHSGVYDSIYLRWKRMNKGSNKAWWVAVAEVIRNKIFEILKTEGVEVTNRGYIEILMPFMERNGYKDGRGWWVKITD